MDIVEITPRQLAPSVGTQRVGSTIPAASSTVKFRYTEMPFGLANSSSTHDSPSAEFDAIYFDSEAAARSITFGSFDFTPHSSMSKLVFKSLNTGLDLAFGDLHFYVNNLGTLRLPRKTHPALVGAILTPIEEEVSSTSSVGSSDSAELDPVYYSGSDTYHTLAEDHIEHIDIGLFSDLENFDRNPRLALIQCALCDPLTNMEETEESQLQREAIEQANAEALAARARSTNVLKLKQRSFRVLLEH